MEGMMFLSIENWPFSRYYYRLATHSTPEQIRALAGGSLAEILSIEAVSHLRRCPECQLALSEARESRLIEEELLRDPMNALDLTSIR